jgi:hypothetical protein
MQNLQKLEKSAMPICEGNCRDDHDEMDTGAALLLTVG